MNDKSTKPVSMRKAAASGQATAERPNAVRVLTAAMLLSGLAAIVAAITLYGQHDYLVRSLSKSQPAQKITNSVISTVSGKAGSTLTSDLTSLVGTKLSAKQISMESDTVGAAVKTALPSKNATADQVKDQVDKAKSAVSSQLKKLSGQITAAQVSTQGKDLMKSVSGDLTDLQKSQLSPSEVQDRANKAPMQILIQNLLLFAALGFVAYGAYAGRHWSRWAVPIVWVLASFTGTAAGFTSVVQLGSDLPIGYKLGGAVSALALIAAVFLTFLRPCKDWFEAHRPAAPADGVRRRGLFASRVPPPSSASRPAKAGNRATASRPGGRFGSASPAAGTAGSAAGTQAKTAGSGATTAKAKKRAAAEATSNGAAVARARAKTASKSRRRTES